jgi:hypothetical protein
MIPFFVGYAMLVWIPVARYRREWQAFLIVLLGFLGLVGISIAHYQLGRLTPSWYIQGMQALLYPYTIMVGAVGLFIALLPRTFEGCCPGCGYSLIGLPISKRRCPECGTDLRPDACPSCAADLRAVPRSEPCCPECGFHFRARRRFDRHRPSGLERQDLRVSDRPLPARQTPPQPEDQDHQRQASDQ